MKPAVALVIVMFLAPLLLADRHHVVADDKADFSALRTFSIREGSAKTSRPELNNKLMFKKIEDAIRAQLSAKGLTESQHSPDLVVSFVLGEDRRRGPSMVFDQGTLVIELTRRDSNSMIWQGVYTDEDSTPAKVAEKLPRNVQKLFSEYPPKKRK
jgi:hypothetical protein